MINQAFGIIASIPLYVVGVFLRHRLVDVVCDKTIEFWKTRCVDLLNCDVCPVLGGVVFGVTVAYIVNKSLDTDVIFVIYANASDADGHIIP